MARLSDLEAVRDGLQARMDVCSSDQNYAVMGRLLVDVIKQIEELAAAKVGTKETGLSEFERRLKERESGTSGPASATRS